MRRSSLLFRTFVVVLLVALPAVIRAQESPDGWSRVLALGRGTTIRITEDDGAKTIGQLESADASGVAITVGLASRTIRRSSVILVERRGTNHKIHNGFLIGAAVGLGQAVATVRGSRAAWYPLLTFSWGGIGAIGGAISAGADRGFETVYVAGPTRSTPCDVSTIQGRTDAVELHHAKGWLAGGMLAGVFAGVLGTGVVAGSGALGDPQPRNVSSALDERCYRLGYASQASRRNWISALKGGVVGTIVQAVVWIGFSAHKPPH